MLAPTTTTRLLAASISTDCANQGSNTSWWTSTTRCCLVMPGPSPRTLPLGHRQPHRRVFVSASSRTTGTGGSGSCRGSGRGDRRQGTQAVAVSVSDRAETDGCDASIVGRSGRSDVHGHRGRQDARSQDDPRVPALDVRSSTYTSVAYARTQVAGRQGAGGLDSTREAPTKAA